MQGIYLLARPLAHVVVVEPLGEHDLDTATHLRGVLLSLIESHELVVLDLTAAEFVDSSVMLTIVQAHRLADGSGLPAGRGRLRASAPRARDEQGARALQRGRDARARARRSRGPVACPARTAGCPLVREMM